MGYCVEQQDSKFFIAAKNRVKALKAIKALVGKGTIEDSTGRNFSWVDDDEVRSAKNLPAAFEAWGWVVEEDDDGTESPDITGIEFQAEKLGDEPVLFKAVAPFVKSGSFIEMSGEDGARWKWVFKDGKFKEIQGKVSYEDSEE